MPGLPEAERTLDHEAVADCRPGSTVDMTPARVAMTCNWTTTADVRRRRAEAALDAVEDRAGAEQRGPAAAHRRDDVVGPAHVEERGRVRGDADDRTARRRPRPA